MVFSPHTVYLSRKRKGSFLLAMPLSIFVLFLPVFTFFGSTFPYCAHTFIFDKLSNIKEIPSKIACQFLASTHQKNRIQSSHRPPSQNNSVQLRQPGSCTRQPQIAQRIDSPWFQRQSSPAQRKQSNEKKNTALWHQFIRSDDCSTLWENTFGHTSSHKAWTWSSAGFGQQEIPPNWVEQSYTHWHG